MFLPIVGLVSAVAVYSAIGIVVLVLASRPDLRPLTLLVFVPFALFGSVVFMIAYGRVFADPAGELRTRPVVIGLLIGTVVAGTVMGWLAAFLVAYLVRKRGEKTGSYLNV